MTSPATTTAPATLAELQAITDAASPGEWYAEPNTGAGRVWVQIGARRRAGADLEPLFNYRTHREPVTEEERQRQFRQREADAAFIVAARTAIPPLLAAVVAVLGRHESKVPLRILAEYGSQEAERYRYCATCSGHPAWPCPEVQAITAALTGKDSSDEP